MGIDSIATQYCVWCAFIGFVLTCIAGFIAMWNGKKKITIICAIVVIAYVVGGFFVGRINIPKWEKEYLATHTECQAYGHKFEKAIPYYDVFEKKLELANVITDKSYEGSLEGNLKENSSGLFFIYHSTTNATIDGELTQKEEYKFYYRTEDGGYKKSSIPVDCTTVYYIEEGENPYIEQFRQYGNWEKCKVCGQEQYKWDKTFYKLYVPKGSIREEFDIN